MAVLLFLALIGTLMLILHDNAKDFVSEYEKTHYRKSLYKAETFASQLCVTDADVAMEGYTQDASLHAVGLFDVQGRMCSMQIRFLNRCIRPVQQRS